MDIATEVEEAAKTAKAQVYSKPEEVHNIQTKKQYHNHQKSSPSSKQASSTQQGWGQVQLTKYSSTPSTPNIYNYYNKIQILQSTGQVLIFLKST